MTNIKVYPGTLKEALLSPTIKAGDRLLLRDGIYNGDYTSTLNGESKKPIIIMPYQDEQPIIDGALSVNGDHTEWNDLEIMYSGWKERENQTSDPKQSLNLYGAGTKMNRCIIHDTAGNGSWSANAGGGFYDCLIYNCGYVIAGAGHGHGIYTQNINPTQYHHNNILWGNYNYGFHGYTEGSKIDYFDIRNNICFANGGRQFLLGGAGGQRTRNSVVSDNCMLEGDGYLKGTDVVLTNNFSPNGFTVEPTSANITSANNTTTKPNSDMNVFIFGNHIAIYNWKGADTVKVNVKGKLHNAQDYYKDVMDVSGEIDMRATSHTIAGRIGGGKVESTFPQFGCFVVEAI